MLINYDKQKYLVKIPCMSLEFRIELMSSYINIQNMQMTLWTSSTYTYNSDY